MQIENVEISEVVDIIDTIEDTLIQDLDPEIKEGDKEKEDRIRKEIVGVIVEEVEEVEANLMVKSRR